MQRHPWVMSASGGAQTWGALCWVYSIEINGKLNRMCKWGLIKIVIAIHRKASATPCKQGNTQPVVLVHFPAKREVIVFCNITKVHILLDL
jgi:hypothetical protein